MKNFLKKLMCFSIAGFICSNVSAATISISDDTTGASQNGKSVALEIKDDNLKDYTSVEFELIVSGTSYASIEYKPQLPSGMSYENNGSHYKIKMTTEGATLYATSIGNISYSTTENLNSSFKIKPTNVKFCKVDGTCDEVDNATVKIDEGDIKYAEPKSDDATLTSLTVSQGTLTPEFKSDVYEYEVTIADTINVITISAKEAEGATKTGTGTKRNLEIGENTFVIEVTAEDGKTQKSYTVVVNRGTLSEPSAYLEDIVINNIGCTLSPKFDSKNNKYTLEVPSGIENLDIEYKLEDKAATATIEGHKNLTVGENLITITVTSSDGEETQVYEIVATIIEDEDESSEEGAAPAKPIDDEDDKDKSISIWVIIGLIAGILLLVGGLAFVLFKKKKTNKNNNKKKSTSKIVEEKSDFENKNVEQLETKLFDDERTMSYEREILNTSKEVDDLEKTKEFNFKDFN